VQGGLIVEVSIFEADQYLVDEVFALGEIGETQQPQYSAGF
jgi:hypothetical protein